MEKTTSQLHAESLFYLYTTLYSIHAAGDSIVKNFDEALLHLHRMNRRGKVNLPYEWRDNLGAREFLAMIEEHETQILEGMLGSDEEYPEEL